jgi:putative Holliday junction resolvase
MGLDVGDATIGVAVSDELKLIAQAINTIRRKNIKEDLKAIESIVDEKKISKIVNL